MSQIPEELIEQVRDAADLVTILGEHVELKRTGTDYRGPCPFHGGTNRNFAVIPKKQMYYCFVCHEAGDVFTFFMKKLGMEYPTAVREVAKQVGITIPERPTAGPDPREPLYGAVAVAAEWYAARLRDGEDAAPARKYLESRGFSVEALLPHGLGFAPKGNAFLEAMRKLGITDEVLFGAGLLVKREDGTPRPRFWGRLLFPIHDLRGRVVGFGGRVIGEGEPKYLNSPDSEVFHKGKLLYNLHAAKLGIRKAERAVLVEGNFDVLRLVEAGIENVVAPLGTGLTPDQAQLLRRFTNDVTLLYDGDGPGLRATFRAADEFLRAGMRVVVATLPPGEDPDTLAAKGGKTALDKVLDDAIDVCERKIQLLERKGWLGSLAGRRKALDRLLPTLRAPKDPVTRDLYVTRTAEALGITREAINLEVDRSGKGSHAPAARSERAEAIGTDGAISRPVKWHGPERTLLRAMLHQVEWRQRVPELVPDRSRLLQPERELIERLIAAPDTAPNSLLAEVDGTSRMLLSELLEHPWGAINVDAEVEGALRKLESRPLTEKLARKQSELKFLLGPEKDQAAREIVSLQKEISVLDKGRWNSINKGKSSAI